MAKKRDDRLMELLEIGLRIPEDKQPFAIAMLTGYVAGCEAKKVKKNVSRGNH